MSRNFFYHGVLKVKDENNRTRIRIQWSEARIRIRTKMSGIHNNTGRNTGKYNNIYKKRRKKAQEALQRKPAIIVSLHNRLTCKKR